MNEEFSLGISEIIKNGIWFIDIPRTSSSSIRIELGRRYGIVYGKTNLIEKEFVSEQIFPDHLTALEMVNILGETIWNKLFTFSIVRNPWDRILSMYFYRRIKQNIPDNWSFSDYVIELGKATEKSNYFEYHGFRYGAADYILDQKNNSLVSSIIKFENRLEGLNEISKHLAISSFGSIHTQQAKPVGINYDKYYTRKTKKIIQNLYIKDIEVFNYSYFDYKSFDSK
jgi:hypothetical protein